jgi:ABC-type multidrug transport system fused ATPase/permease subunit
MTQRTTTFSLQGIFRRFRWKILVTFGLLLIENSLSVVEPYLLGIAINDLLSGVIRGVIYVIVLEFGKLLLGVGRRMYDTRTYSAVYASLAPETVEYQKAQNTPLSAIVARSQLVKELVDFFEHDLTQGFSSLIAAIGAVMMLLVLDIRLFWGCLAAILSIGLVYALSEKRIFRFNQALNDEQERQVDIITHQTQFAVIKHFRTLARWYVKLSDLEAINFGLIELILTALVLFSLFIAVDVENPSPGSIFAVVSYVLEFVEGVFVLPWIFQQFIRLKEITQRLHSNGGEVNVSS